MTQGLNFTNLYNLQLENDILFWFEEVNAPPDSSLISNVSLVPYVGDKWVIIQLNDGRWELPGGTLELGESYEEALHREIMEEVGASIVSHSPLGVWKHFSFHSKPYRQHLPHPVFYRYVLVGDIKLIGLPSNPLNAEQVSSVAVLSLKEVIEAFASQGRKDLAELYLLASSVLYKHATVTQNT